MSLLDTTQLALEAAMRGSMLRQSLLANNMANVDTPGYQREDVSFQGTLESAIRAGQPLDQVTFQPYTQMQATGPDGNGVSMDQEAAYVAENGLLYQELTQVATARDHILMTAMGMGSVS
jgi:flagellar basal-body rod protein FlgB